MSGVSIEMIGIEARRETNQSVEKTGVQLMATRCRTTYLVPGAVSQHRGRRKSGSPCLHHVLRFGLNLDLNFFKELNHASLVNNRVKCYDQEILKPRFFKRQP